MIYIVIVIGGCLLVMGWQITSLAIEIKIKTNNIAGQVVEVIFKLPTLKQDLEDLKSELEGLKQDIEVIKGQTKSGASVPDILTEIRNDIFDTYKKVDDSRKAIRDDLEVLHDAVQKVKGSS